jgi:hypothetical protein
MNPGAPTIVKAAASDSLKWLALSRGLEQTPDDTRTETDVTAPVS